MESIYIRVRDWVLAKAWQGVEFTIICLPPAFVAVLVFRIGFEFGRLTQAQVTPEGLQEVNRASVMALLGLVSVSAFIPYVWFKYRARVIEGARTLIKMVRK